MRSGPHVPLKLVLGLGLAIALDTAAQLFWKIAVSRLPEAASIGATVTAALSEPVFLLVVVLLVGQMFNWLKVLDHADLSFAQPITALSYISVTILSAVTLHEKLGSLQIAGIGCILAGVWFISRTDPVTPQADP